MPDLYTAFTAWFRADAELTAAFPGGLAAGRAGIAQGYPHARVAWRKAQPSLSHEDQPYRVALAAYALSDDDAATLGELLARRYLDEARPPLTFTDNRGVAWREAHRLEQDVTGPEWVETLAAVDGGPEGDVWRYRVPFDVLCTRA